MKSPGQKINVTLPPNFQLLNVLGKGSFGIVVSAFDNLTSRKVAIKIISI